MPVGPVGQCMKHVYVLTRVLGFYDLCLIVDEIHLTNCRFLMVVFS